MLKAKLRDDPLDWCGKQVYVIILYRDTPYNKLATNALHLRYILRYIFRNNLVQNTSEWVLLLLLEMIATFAWTCEIKNKYFEEN